MRYLGGSKEERGTFGCSEVVRRVVVSEGGEEGGDGTQIAADHGA